MVNHIGYEKKGDIFRVQIQPASLHTLLFWYKAAFIFFLFCFFCVSFFIVLLYLSLLCH